jgi:hypothetical protein
VILDVLLWLAIADAVAAAALAVMLYIVGRKSKERVPARTAVGIGVILAAPAGLVYAAVWICLRLAAKD